jgi:hypothetical protein
MPFIGKQPSRGLVGSADIDDNAVTLAKMAHQADGSIITYGTDTAPVLLAPDTSGEVLTTKGAGALPAFDAVSAGFTLGTDTATTSGTSVTFGSIPAGTKFIIIMFEDFSMDSSPLDITIGDSGGLETSGYVASGEDNDSLIVTSTSEFIMEPEAGGVHAGHIFLTLKDASNFTWVMSGVMKQGPNLMGFGAGNKSLSAELTQVSISGGTFDAGSVNITYI